MENIFMKMEIFIKGIGKMMKKMEKEFIYIKMESKKEEFIKKENCNEYKSIKR
jgi:hypothetical protein